MSQYVGGKKSPISFVSLSATLTHVDTPMAWASVRAALVPALDAPSKPITTAEQLESDLETSYAAACKLHAQTGFRADSSADSRIIRDVCNAYARVVSSPLFALPGTLSWFL
jgi:hypothetical protein